MSYHVKDYFSDDFQQNNSGLIAIAFIIGYVTSVPFVNSSDRFAAYLSRKNNNIREAEMRLGVMLPAMLIGPAGLVVYGFTAQRDLHWIGYFAGVAMVDWSALFFFTLTLAYAIDSYNANMSEMLIAMNIGKNGISFGMGYVCSFHFTDGSDTDRERTDLICSRGCSRLDMQQ